ncbi:MAG: M6 family metalloprotease domain-containing protein [Muribaculaceae bacterium]|nr:M6 family metalloprotease domain-containing protein [Muribaculaceae bacterium]
MKMLKYGMIGAAAMLCAATAFAVPAKPGLRTYTQPDGTKISLQLVGDEFYHTLVTPDGVAMNRDTDGFYRPISQEVVNSRRAAAKQRRTAPRKISQVPSSGSPKVPVLLVEYSDYKFKDADPLETFRNFFDNGPKSAYQYYVDQSKGKYTPQFDVYGPITLSGTRATYGGNTYSGNDRGVGAMVGQACQGLDSKIDFSKYDNDGDGECDVIIVIYAGDGEASSYDPDCENAIWPCQWSLSSSDFRKSLTLDNTKVDKFAVFNELNGSDLSKIDGIGTFCHEFSHCLDLPDFYDTNYGPHFGMANWSLLDYGCYNDDGYTPVGYTAYEKSFFGWIDLEEVKENTFYTLPVFGKEGIEDRALKVTNSKDPNEYYVIENRARQGWDKFMPAEGLLITHVTYSAAAWNGNYVNDYDLQRMTPVPADNSLKLNTKSSYGQIYYEVDEQDLLGDLWPWGKVNELTDTSTPAAKVNTGGLMGKPITEITRNDDGTISLWVMKSPLAPVAAPIVNNHEIHNSTDITLNWTPGDDNDVTYTVEIFEHQDAELVYDVDFTSATLNWAINGYTVVEDNALRFGSNKNTGAATSPVFNTGNFDKVTFNFTAKSYNSDATEVTISLLNKQGTEICKNTVALTGQYADYSVTLPAEAGEDVKVCIATTSNKKRFYLTKGQVWLGQVASAGVKGMRAAEQTSRTLTGLTGNSVRIDGLKAGGTFDYRMRAVPTDPTSFDASQWTEPVTVTLSGTSAIEISTATSDREVQWFDLQGRKIAKPSAPGIYLNSERRKVVIR